MVIITIINTTINILLTHIIVMIAIYYEVLLSLQLITINSLSAYL